MAIFFLFMSLAFANDDEVRNLLERTFTRNNTYCKIGKERIEIQVRGVNSKTEPGEKKYGEHIFYYVKETAKLLPLNSDGLSNYRLFEGQSSICSKAHAYQIDKDHIALLFLKENRPQRDTLTLQLFNTDSMAPDKVIDTEYLTEKVEQFDGGFIFDSYLERTKIKMGNIKIKDIEYTYQDRDFPFWISYNKAGFTISANKTFEEFPFKELFKDKNDFLNDIQWNDTEKKIQKNILYVAVNHKLKKECILITGPEQKVDGSETGWRCR
jgi:hypothetical protein